MGFEERRRRKLTPMTGELRTEMTWEPSEPERQKPKKKKRRSGRAHVVLAGLRRSAIALVILSALVCGAALLLVTAGDIQPERAFPLAFYIGGAIIVCGGFFGATMGPAADWMPERGFDYEDHASALNRSFVYAVFGVLLIAVGAVVDWQT